MGNKKKQEEINRLIKEDLAYLFELANRPLHEHLEPGDNRKIHCYNDHEIIWSNEHLLSIQYSRLIEYDNGIAALQPTVNINIDTNQKLMLKDLFIINDEFIKKWYQKKILYDGEVKNTVTSTRRKYWANSKESPNVIDEYTNSNELLKIFNRTSDNFYLSEDKLGIWIYIMGSKAFLETQTYYSDLKEFIKDKNDPIWQGLKIE
jgi:hypothetical protein